MRSYCFPTKVTVGKFKENLNKIETKTNIPEKKNLKFWCFSWRRNYFSYNDQSFCKQIDECPMGSTISPCIADFIMNKIIDKIRTRYNNDLPEDFGTIYPQII